jgi:hypothetical protein
MNEQDSDSGPGTPTDKHGADDRASKTPSPARKSRWRPGVWLATLSTVVAVATGMFTLRDQIVPSSAGRAEADPTAFEYSVGGICDALNEDERTLVANDHRLANQLKRATTLTSQRNAILDSWDEVLNQSQYELAQFEGLQVPASFLVRERETQQVWSPIAELERQFVERLNAATDESDLSAAIQTLPAARTTIASDGVTLGAGLTYLGQGHCTLDGPVNIPTVTLHPITPPVKPPSSTTKTSAPPVTPPTGPTTTIAPPVTPPTGPTTTIAPPVTPPTGTTTTTAPPINTTTTTATAGGG